jgi:hypothetical protein
MMNLRERIHHNKIVILIIVMVLPTNLLIDNLNILLTSVCLHSRVTVYIKLWFAANFHLLKQQANVMYILVAQMEIFSFMI